jgi:zinc transport system substrate-binding protein
MIFNTSFFKSFITKFYLIFLLFLGITPLFQSCSILEDKENSALPHIVTSIAPYKYFVERIAGDSVSIGVLVPDGESPHTFEPTPKQIIQASKAKVWLQVGDPFEQQMLTSIKQTNPAMQIIDLREGLPLLSAGHHHHCHGHAHGHSHGHNHKMHKDCMDVHTWLSPKLAMKQAQAIADALIQALPEKREEFTSGLEALLLDIQALDDDISAMLIEYKDRSLLFSHSAFIYFCHDYNLQQFSVECEGKEPHPSYITKTLEKARNDHVKSIFIQRECSEKGGRRIAEELGLDIVLIHPYAENYLENMRHISLEFRKELSRYE